MTKGASLKGTINNVLALLCNTLD